MNGSLKWKLYLISSVAFLRAEIPVHQLILFLTLPQFCFHLLRCCICKCYNEQVVDIDWIFFIYNLLIIRSTNTAVFRIQLLPRLKYHVRSLQPLSTGHLSIDYLLVLGQFSIILRQPPL